MPLLCSGLGWAGRARHWFVDAVDSLHASVAASLCSATEQCCVKMTQCSVENTANITEDSQPVVCVSSGWCEQSLCGGRPAQISPPVSRELHRLLAASTASTVHCTALLCSVQVDRARAETRDGPDCYFPFMEAIRIRISSDLCPMVDDPTLFTLHSHSLDFIHSCPMGPKLFPSSSTFFWQKLSRMSRNVSAQCS